MCITYTAYNLSKVQKHGFFTKSIQEADKTAIHYS